MAELIEFDTERLRLRQWCAADREIFAALNADRKVMEFMQKFHIAIGVSRTPFTIIQPDAISPKTSVKVGNRVIGGRMSEIKQRTYTDL